MIINYNIILLKTWIERCFVVLVNAYRLTEKACFPGTCSHERPGS